MTYKTLLFDLDGTLLNTLTDLSNALNHALSRNGYPTHTETACARMVGNGVAVLIARALKLDPLRVTKDFLDQLPARHD